MAVFFELKAGDQVEYTYTTDQGGIDTKGGVVEKIEGVNALVRFRAPLRNGWTCWKWLPRRDLSYIPPTYTHCQERGCTTTFATGSTAFHTGICWDCLQKGFRITNQQIEHLTWEIEWRSRSEYEESREKLPRLERDLAEILEERARLEKLDALAKRYR